MTRRPVRVWHVACGVIALCAIVEICKIDPWLLAGAAFAGVLAL